MCYSYIHRVQNFIMNRNLIMKYAKGNLLEMFKNKQFDAIAHGCNCFCTMGAGVAGQIATTYPGAYEVDKNTKYADDNKLGYLTAYLTDTDQIIFNLYTQYAPGKEDQSNLEQNIKLAFTKLKTFIEPTVKLGIPKIGCGIAGGNWDIIEAIIDSVMEGYDVTCVEFTRG